MCGRFEQPEDVMHSDVECGYWDDGQTLKIRTYGLNLNVFMADNIDCLDAS